MAKHNETGEKGEALATAFLESEGYRILETNWRFKRAEVDIIAYGEVQDIMVFVEVKTRSTDAFGSPDAFVGPKKEKLLADAATVYCQQVGHDWEIRFDIIAILWPEGGESQITHIPDAFFPHDY